MVVIVRAPGRKFLLGLALMAFGIDIVWSAAIAHNFDFACFGLSSLLPGAWIAYRFGRVVWRTHFASLR